MSSRKAHRSRIGNELAGDAEKAGLRKERVHGYDVYFEPGDEGYSSFAPTLPGCVSAGGTITECKRHMKDAIELHLEGMEEDGLAPPPRDGRAAPRPHRAKGRYATIPSRVSPQTAKILERISRARGVTKTEAVEMAIESFGKRTRKTG